MSKHLFPILLSCMLLGGMVTLVGFALVEEDNARYERLEVHVEEVKGMFFVDAAGVQDAIFKHDSVAGTFVADLSLHAIAEWVQAIPAVQAVEAYPGLNRSLHVRVTQRQPLARLHTSQQVADLYIDIDGRALPLSPHFTARVPIIHAPSLEDASTAFNLIKITSSDPFWAAFIDQVVVGDDRQLEIIPRVGGARISVGTLENLQTKLDNLLTFYQAQIARGNLNDYKRIDLAFEGQVVAQRYY